MTLRIRIGKSVTCIAYLRRLCLFLDFPADCGLVLVMTVGFDCDGASEKVSDAPFTSQRVDFRSGRFGVVKRESQH